MGNSQLRITRSCARPSLAKTGLEQTSAKRIEKLRLIVCRRHHLMTKGLSRRPKGRDNNAFRDHSDCWKILKLVVSILFGGAAGALLNEWFRRRKGKVQRVALIERVNRSANPELQGITLARMVGEEPLRHLE